MRTPGNLVLQDVRILFPNFSGVKKQFNPEGKRNIAVVIPNELAPQLLEDGWNVKSMPSTDDYEETWYLKVNITYGPYPPMIYMITNQKTLLDESTISLLDMGYITNADVIINASAYDVNGKTGISAYLKKGYFEIEQDELDLKHADIPASNMGTYEEY